MVRILARKQREKGREEIFGAIITENFLKLISQTKPQIPEAQRTPTK
jgi:hypothetical protein